MSRRIAILGAVAILLALTGVAGRFVHHARVERDFEAGMETLRGLALQPTLERRMWEPRFEALSERLRHSPGFDQLSDSIHRPHVAWGGEAPRELDDFETAWVEAAWSEFTGLDATLGALRGIDPEDLEWHGESVTLHVLRECINVLCARAWQAVSRGHHSQATQIYADALRLLCGTDNGTMVALLVRHACARTVLDSARSALAFGLPAGVLRASLTPFLNDWKYDPEEAEHRIRRDLAWCARYEEGAEVPYDSFTDQLPLLVRDVEQGLAIARQPLADTPWALGYPSSPIGETQTLATRTLHAIHAQRNVALSALAVAAYQEEHGTWPTSLAELDGLPAEQTLDTLTKASLPYSIDEHCARVGPASWGERIDGIEDLDRSPYVWILLPEKTR